MPGTIEAHPGLHFGASGRHSTAMNARLIGSKLKTDLAAAMIQRFFAPTLGLLIGLALGSCAPFAATVSDHWPTWAGGMPKDVPPRPGAPGYDEFLRHQQGKDAAPAAPLEGLPMRKRRLAALSRPAIKEIGAGRLILAVSGDDEFRSRDAGAKDRGNARCQPVVPLSTTMRAVIFDALSNCSASPTS